MPLRDCAQVPQRSPGTLPGLHRPQVPQGSPTVLQRRTYKKQCHKYPVEVPVKKQQYTCVWPGLQAISRPGRMLNNTLIRDNLDHWILSKKITKTVICAIEILSRKILDPFDQNDAILFIIFNKWPTNSHSISPLEPASFFIKEPQKNTALRKNLYKVCMIAANIDDDQKSKK